jgi:AraC-like DNA-binding protein
VADEPLIQNEVARPFLASIEQLGGSAEELASRVGFSAEVLERPVERMPERLLFAISALAARELERQDFGLVAGRDQDLSVLGSLGASIEQSLTLFDAIRTCVRGLGRVSSHSHWWVERNAENLWFRRARIDGCDHGEEQGELYVIGLMTRIVRIAVGDTWTPAHTDTQQVGELDLRELEDTTELRRGQPHTGIAIPLRLLPTPIPRPSGEATLEQLRDWLSSRARESLPTIEEASEAQRVSPRTLQRLLAPHGLTYRRLVGQVRYDLALRALADPDASLCDVAQQLGYSDQAHFTRAFQQWTTLTPGAYRRSRTERLTAG